MKQHNPCTGRENRRPAGATRKRLIYPIFLPHAGCPFRCVYCNQNCVTTPSDGGSGSANVLASFHSQLQLHKAVSRDRVARGDVALYGGTFTALPQGVQAEILNALADCVDEGSFTGIRFSTRPDGISSDTRAFLQRYPIRTIELGVQSFSDPVLEASCRGYDAAAAVAASALVKEAGWELGIQLMAGLPGDRFSRFRHSVLQTLAIEPAMVRLYPTLVLKGTKLASWLTEGRFSALSLDDAIEWCSWAYESFLQAGISVARMGLHADPEFMRPGTILAGPFHPAFGYLVRVRGWRNRIDATIGKRQAVNGTGSLSVRVGERFLSEVVGPGRENLAFWMQKWQLATIRVQREREWPADRFECVWE